MKKLLRVLFLLLCGGAALSFGALFYIYSNLPILDLNVELEESTLIFDKEGKLLDEIHGEYHRKVVPLEDIDSDLKAAVLAIEDKRFYQHSGVDPKGVVRAAKENIKAGSIESGASTITMQTIKNLYLTPEKTWIRKINEAFLAIKLEQQLSKDEIFELYLNAIYWGNNTYGIQTATETYFGKGARDMEVHEAAMLAALIQNPSRYNPYAGEESYALLKSRQREVLLSMAENIHYASHCDALLDEEIGTCQRLWVTEQHQKPLVVTGKKTWQKSTLPFVTDAAIAEFQNKYDLTMDDIKTGGYRITTTVKTADQQKALDSIAVYDTWYGSAQMALVSVDVNTHKIVATVGSRDYNTSPLNRSIESYRQPGSSIKPFVYYTAFAYGWTPEHTINDEEYCIGKTTRYSKAYCPKNYGGSYSGEDTIRNHLKKSRNIPAVKIGQIVGIGNVIKNMKKLGFTTKLEPYPSFPLGSNDLKPVEMANAYAAFANGGYYNDYTILEKVTNTKGDVIIDNKVRSQEKVLNGLAVIKLDSILQDVVSSGTGTRAFISGITQGGKTGTTDAQADVWFVGYTDDISTAVWIGNDNYHKKLYGGATGGGWAAPVYRQFVKRYYGK